MRSRGRRRPQPQPCAQSYACLACPSYARPSSDLLLRPCLLLSIFSYPNLRLCFASRCSVQRGVQKFINRAQNCASIVTCLRFKQFFADERVDFRFAQLDCQTAQSVSSALTVPAHALGRGREMLARRRFLLEALCPGCRVCDAGAFSFLGAVLVWVALRKLVRIQ